MANKITVGVIGCGRIGKLHIDNLVHRIPDVTVKKVADINIDAAQDWLANWGITETTMDYHEILDDPEIQAVFILSPTATHAQFSIEAAQAGKDIFCEKPIDLDVERVREVLRAVDQAGVKYQIGFNRRFDHNFKHIRDIVQSGEIGDPHVIKITSRDPGYSIDYLRTSCGILFDMCIHDLDMARYLSGLEVQEVYASGGVLIDPAIGEFGDVDTIVINLKFTNGAMAIIDGSRQAVYGYDQRIEVFGAAGMAITPNDKPSLVEVFTKDAPKTDKIHYFFLERYAQAFLDEVNDFLTCIRENKTPPVTGVDCLNAILIAVAAKKSLDEHRPVNLSDVDVE
ncbi:MAG TPA: inositol 2-dehydrogenase [Candidatus Lokiarchaeia archaeon]|nr:inositol 2-dehydrogenase [Candidatus Lokiarchaeia archaeon]